MTNWNSKGALEWEWEKLAGLSPKVDILKQGQPSSHDFQGDNGSVYSSGGDGFSSSDLGHASSSKSSFSTSADSLLKEGVHTYVTVDEFPKGLIEEKELTRVDSSGNISCLGVSESSGEPTIGLKFGKRTYFEEFCAANSTKTPSISVVPTSFVTSTKRSRASYQSRQTPRCQVEGCNLDLKLAKDYHRRHRICEIHSKSPKVIVAEMEIRFCQQCSRFHELFEFDDKKRSCRRRLSDHNARRRRPQPEAVQFNSTMLSSSLYVLASLRHTSRDLTRPAKAEGFDRRLNFPTREMLNAPSIVRINSSKVLSSEGTMPQVLIQGLGTSAFCPDLDVAPDFRRALSLLSTNSLGLNNSEANSLDQLVHVNQISAAWPLLHAQQQNWALPSLDHQRVVQPYPESHVHSLNFLNGRNIPFQEFQLFKGPYESGCFYSNQMN